jgi:hypothetical protein
MATRGSLQGTNRGWRRRPGGAARGAESGGGGTGTGGGRGRLLLILGVAGVVTAGLGFGGGVALIVGGGPLATASAVLAASAGVLQVAVRALKGHLPERRRPPRLNPPPAA